MAQFKLQLKSEFVKACSYLPVIFDRYRKVMQHRPMGFVAKHEQIAQELATDLEKGTYVKGGRFPPEEELAARFEVSRPTIARALQALKQRGLLESRQGSGTYVCQAGTQARELALLLPGLDIGSEFFGAIAGELATLARTQGYTLVLPGANAVGSATTASPMDEVMRTTEQIITRRVDGVIFAPVEFDSKRESGNSLVLEKLQSAGIPVVLIDRDLAPFGQRSAYDLVACDNFNSGFTAANHLLKALGKKQKIGFVCRHGAAPTVDLRLAGAREALSRANYDVPKDFVLAGDPADLGFAESIKSAGFGGLICATDRIAAEIIHSLRRTGLIVPHDVKLVSHDDMPFAQLLTPPLTTMRQPLREITWVTLKTLLERIEQPGLPPRTILLNAELKVRDSCGTCPAA